MMTIERERSSLGSPCRFHSSTKMQAASARIGGLGGEIQAASARIGGLGGEKEQHLLGLGGWVERCKAASARIGGLGGEIQAVSARIGGLGGEKEQHLLGLGGWVERCKAASARIGGLGGEREQWIQQSKEFRHQEFSQSIAFIILAKLSLGSIEHSSFPQDCAG